MITHEYHQTKMKGRQILLWDFLVPLLLISGVAYFLDRKYWHPLLQGIVDLPLVGLPFYKSRMFVDYVHWHYLIFWAPIFLISFAVSFRTARIPGPGRAVLRWWQGLLQLKVKKEIHVETFPPLFNRQHAAILRFIEAVEDKESHSRVLGFYKRFPSDLARETHEGKVPEKATDFLPIIISEEERYRHIQVIGGSGSGKSASVLAPMLLGDAAESDLATLTINPKADLYLLKVLADGVRKAKKRGSIIPTAVISFSRKDSLSYDPLLYGDADALTKKIIGSSEINHPFYRAFQETWLMSFFRVFKTEALLVDRLMLRHLYHYLTKPTSLLDEIRPLCKSENNLRRLSVLAAAKPESLAGVASHVSLLVEDESLAHIFDNPKGRLLNVIALAINNGYTLHCRSLFSLA